TLELRWNAKSGARARLFFGRLQRMVLHRRARFGDRLALFEHRADFLFGGIDLFGNGEHFVFARLRNAYDAVGIAAQDVAGVHARVADVHRHLLGVDLHAVLAGAHRVATRIDRVAEAQAQVHV